MTVRVCLTLCSCSSQKERAELSLRSILSVDCSPLRETVFLPPVRGACAHPCRPSPRHQLSPHPSIPCCCAPTTGYPSVTWLRQTWPSCMCVPAAFPPCPVALPPRPRVWFSLLSLSGPCPPPPPLGPFSPSLSRFRKEASSAAPSGTTPPAQIPSTEKKPDPPVRPARSPGPFVTQEPHLGRNGMGASVPPTHTSALPFRPASLWPDRTGALLLPLVLLTWTGEVPCPQPLPF